jgi:hypothetical protein
LRHLTPPIILVFLVELFSVVLIAFRIQLLT